MNQMAFTVHWYWELSIDRPEDCDCSPQFEDLPCWPCFREGFETPNPDLPDDEEKDTRQKAEGQE